MKILKRFLWITNIFLVLFLLSQTLYAEWINMTPSFFGVWGTAANNVFAVGLEKSIFHYDGSMWSSMLSGTSSILYGVWGSAANDVFAVCDGGTILHWNGSVWSSMETNMEVKQPYAFLVYGGARPMMSLP